MSRFWVDFSNAIHDHGRWSKAEDEFMREAEEEEEEESMREAEMVGNPSAESNCFVSNQGGGR